jgi:hypothetical protein
MQADGHAEEPQGLGSNRRETTYRPKPKEASGRHAAQPEKMTPGDAVLRRCGGLFGATLPDRAAKGRIRWEIGTPQNAGILFYIGQRLACFWLLNIRPVLLCPKVSG